MSRACSQAPCRSYSSRRAPASASATAATSAASVTIGRVLTTSLSPRGRHLVPGREVQHLRAETENRPSGRLLGGAEGIRTPDLLIANETRYQLRHSPLMQRKSY